jgi:hypothetical protein
MCCEQEDVISVGERGRCGMNRKVLFLYVYEERCVVYDAPYSWRIAP